MVPYPDHHGSGAGRGRHRFLKGSSAAMVLAAPVTSLPFIITGHAAPDDPIRIGVIRRGGRGIGAVLGALGAGTKDIYPAAGHHTDDARAGATVQEKNINVVALCNLFPDRINRCSEQLRRLAPPIKVPTETCFTDFDGYKNLLAIPANNEMIRQVWI